MKADNGAKLVENFQRNAPKAMFVLLPAFAVLMMLFFWSPRRLYAEHLLFLIHNHSAIFAIARLQEAVAEHRRSKDSGPDLSISAGLADWDPSSDESLDDLIKRADRKMYAHKRSK